MRKVLISMFAAAILCGCESFNIDDISDGKGYDIKFVFGTISQSDFEDADTRATKNISEIASVVNFAVFQDGQKLKIVNKQSGDEDFGSVSLKLPEGTYEFVAVAHNGIGNATISTPEKITFKDNKVTDTFLYYAELEVTEDGEYNATMERVVAMFRLHIEQSIPEDVESMKFYYTGGSSTLNAVTGFGNVNSRQNEIREVTSHSADQKFDIYTFPHETAGTLSITVSALDADDETYYTKELQDVPITIRRITTYRGMFFTSTSSSGEMVIPFTADDSWDGEDEYNFD